MSPIEINGETTESPAGSTLFDAAEALGVRVPASCERGGKCRECIIEVTRGMEALSPRDETEAFLEGGYRLACRAVVEKPDALIRAHTPRRGRPRILVTEFINVDRPDPAVRRDGDRVTLDGEVIDDYRGGVLGLAADIGTTTVVLICHDLESGRQLGVTSFENPQMFGGSDVMSRIRYDGRAPTQELRRVLVAYLNHAIADLGVDPQCIYEMTVAGNTTMRDLFFRLDVQSIGQKPFKSLIEHERDAGRRTGTSLTATAKRLGLEINPRARVYGLPLIGCHVGADAAACAAAIGLCDEDRTVMLMDIGTNTELLLGNKHRVLAASCPAGPAFEGGGIGCGMPGLEGAIEAVRIRDGQTRYTTIGAAPAQGVCGSGIIDVLAELARCEKMTVMGRLAPGEDSFVIDAERGIALDEREISALAQAKAAHAAGVRILLQRFGIGEDQLDRFYLAGGFANYIDVENAIAIGLIPALPLEKIDKIGNGSIVGASKVLLSVTARRRLERFVDRIKHVELETDPAFFDAFVEGCMFTPLDL